MIVLILNKNLFNEIQSIYDKNLEQTRNKKKFLNITKGSYQKNNCRDYTY